MKFSNDFQRHGRSYLWQGVWGAASVPGVNNKLAPWASSLLVVAGVVLIGAFFLAWIAGGGPSGWQLAHDERWLFAIPASGLLLALAAGTESKYTRLAALAAGLLVCGDFAYHLLSGVVHSNLSTWMLLGGAATMLLGIPHHQRALRAVGGAAVLLAFFSPWEHRMIVTIDISLSDLLSVMGIAIILVYASMLAAVVAIISAFTTKPWGQTAALIAGFLVFLAYFWMLLAIATLFLGWGAWMTLGASSAALVVAVIAPSAIAARAIDANRR